MILLDNALTAFKTQITIVTAASTVKPKSYINSYFHAAVVNNEETIAVFVPTMNDHLPVHERYIFIFMENIGFFTLNDSSLDWRMYLESCLYANSYFGMVDKDTRFYQRHLTISLS